MPSGSHRTSGGSHRSGGASSGSRTRSSSDNRTRSYRVHRHRGFWGWGGFSFGPHSKFIIYCIMLFVFAPIFTFGGISMLNAHKHDLELVEQDYRYYQDMIAFAKANDSEETKYIIIGTVTGKFLSDYGDKWYLKYSFKSNDGLEVFDGETYAIYDYEDVKSIIPNVTTIELAADSYMITENTDTVNMDYEFTSLEDDGYYLELKKDSNKPIAIIIICCGVGSGVFGLYKISTYPKSLKKTRSSKRFNDDETSTSNSANDSKSKTKYCSYCGCVIPAGKRKCPSCNSKGN